MDVVSENTAVTLSLVCTLVAAAWSFAFFLTRFVTKADFEKAMDRIETRLASIDDRLDSVLLRQ